eukprot:6491607-Amphidinium_carterae.2
MLRTDVWSDFVHIAPERISAATLESDGAVHLPTSTAALAALFMDAAVGPKRLIQLHFAMHCDGVLATPKEVVARARLLN